MAGKFKFRRGRLPSRYTTFNMLQINFSDEARIRLTVKEPRKREVKAFAVFYPLSLSMLDAAIEGKVTKYDQT